MPEDNKDFEHEETLDEQNETVEIEKIDPEDNTGEIEYIEVEAEFEEIDEKSDETSDEVVKEIEETAEEVVVKTQTKVKKKRPKTKVKVKEKKVKSNKNKNKEKNKNRPVIILALVLLLALGSYFAWTYFNQHETVNPFELISVKVVGTDGNGSLEIEKNNALTKEQEEIYNRIRYEVKDNGNFHTKDKAQVSVIIEDEAWFKEKKINLTPLKELYTVDFLMDKIVFKWQDYITYDLDYERGVVSLDKLQFSDNTPEELADIMSNSKLKTDKKNYDFKDTVKISLDLKSNDMKKIHEKGYELQGIEHEFTIEDFVYTPKYFEDIPKQEYLQEKSLAQLEGAYQNAQDINLERVCYLFKDQATIYYLYSFKQDEQEKAAAFGYDNIKGIGHELDESSLRPATFEESNLSDLQKTLEDENFHCTRP